MDTANKLKVHSFFDQETSTVTHIVADKQSGKCCVIDSVLDYDPASGHTGTTAADQVIACIQENNLTLEWILETHAHADHITAAPYLQAELGGKIGVGANISGVQQAFSSVFNLGDSFETDGSQFDHLFEDGEEFRVGDILFKALSTPGHTPACVTYVTAGHAFVGDTLFMPDYGTARCDFPGGDAAILFDSIQKILSLPENTTLHMCHDYMPGGRDAAWTCSVQSQKNTNVHVHDGIVKTDFVEMRHTRDATLNLPTLLLPSIQVNIRAGHFPEAESNEVSFLKIPLNFEF